jgi:hypothetical protein
VAQIALRHAHRNAFASLRDALTSIDVSARCA